MEAQKETYAFKHGGLMRCCLQSLDDAMVHRQDLDQPLTAEGDTVDCRWCETRMRCQGGYWLWAGKKEGEG